ncbi:hypothetical protein TTHERM_00762910 (macronuclear) [Tetrahymena thermophila SB210]|uniref:Uncharacterized protein n=1 Tax=Tetrahymena thermophila (strain SB210) TaxID=312017 RepID=I7MJ47_TETTS|nr:hypothetical protein TTHERM_00762910 [Tetrahymena thermophila SB210]EAS05104.2 hypothetical protein TTHERM_00762910 [Tetrahymena thermophila SB210]|eukprot:XP_001025349.2 hypothetical protein TTHERM_00762910 [Tetrahymena thermophila SB210]
MYQPFAQGSNRAFQKTSGQTQIPQQQQPMNYQRVYPSSNQQQFQNVPPIPVNQQVKPSTVVLPQQQVKSSTQQQAAPLSAQNMNRQSQQAYFPQQQQQNLPSQRFSQYSQQQKPQQFKIVNGSQYSSTSATSLQSQPSSQITQKTQPQYYQPQTPQQFSSVPSQQTSKTSTMYQGVQTYDRKPIPQQIQFQNQQVSSVPMTYQQYVAQSSVQQQQQLQQQQQQQQQQVQVLTLNQKQNKLLTSIQQLQHQIQSLTQNYQQRIQQRKMATEELNIQKTSFRLQVENIYNQCRKLSSEYPTILCIVTRLSSGDIGIRRANGTNQTEREINHLISLIEDIYLQFTPQKLVQQSFLPVTNQNDQLVKVNQGSNTRDSIISTTTNINVKKSTENLKTIIEESREKPVQEKENSHYYSPIVHAYARGRDVQENLNQRQREEDQDIHQYGSTQKERMNTSPDLIQVTDRGYQAERQSYRTVTYTPSQIVSNSKNPFTPSQTLQKQFTFSEGVLNSQAKQNGSYYTQRKDQQIVPNQIQFMNQEIDSEKVKRANAQSVVGNTLKTQGPTSQTPLYADTSSQQRVSTIPQQNYVYDQFKQAQDFTKLLKDTNQFKLETTNKDLQKLMEEEKYEQVSEYAYQTLTVIDRQIINMKATVESALEQTELVMTKNLLLDIIENLRQTVKSKEIDISHRVINKIQKNTARLLKDKTASYSLYLYLQKIINYLKERESILNTSIQANEMSLLNQTDHSFWMNTKIDNNDPKQIMPIIENAKKSNSAETTSLNFQFFLRDNMLLDLPTYVPMKEQKRLEEEVRQSIQQGVTSSTVQAPNRFSFQPNQNSQFNQNVVSSGLKPSQFQSQLAESQLTTQSINAKQFGVIQPPEYVPYSQSKSLERPKSAQSLNVLGYRSPVSNLNPTTDSLYSNNTVSNIGVSPNILQTNETRGNKFLQDFDTLKRSASIPARMFVQEENVKKSTPNKDKVDGVLLNEQFAHQRKLIKTQFTTSPNKTVPVIKQSEQATENHSIQNTPSMAERKIIQIQKIASFSGAQESNKNSDVKVVNPSNNNNNYSISHLMTPPGTQVNKIFNDASFAVQSSNNTSNLDNILNKYKVVDVEREIQQGQVVQQINQVQSISLSNNKDISNNEAIVYSQIEVASKKEDEKVKRSQLSSNVAVNPSSVIDNNRENNPNLSVGVKRQVNLQYESILEKYIPNNNQKSLVSKYSLPQNTRPALEQVNLQSTNQNYSTQNIFKSPSQINHNDPLQSVSDKYSIIINQQQESLQRTSLNFNTQQQQKKFYDLALKVKSEFPKTHKANTVLVNQMWDLAQDIPENQWRDFILQQCNSAK